MLGRDKETYSKAVAFIERGPRREGPESEFVIIAFNKDRLFLYKDTRLAVYCQVKKNIDERIIYKLNF